MAAQVKPRLLGLSGSIRKGSYNGAILAALAEIVFSEASLELFPLNDVPLYNHLYITRMPIHKRHPLQSLL